MSDHRNQSPPVDRSAFAGYRFPPEVIMLAVRWYLRYGLSYRDVEELLIERGIEVDHVTIHRWVQRFTPLPIDPAAARSVDGGLLMRPTSKSPGNGATSTALLISRARSSMSSSHRRVTSARPAPSSTQHWSPKANQTRW